MKVKPYLTVFLLMSLVLNTFAQTSAPAATSQAEPQLKPLQGFGLEDGVPIKLRIGRTVSSADAHVGDNVDFEVLEDVKVGDVVVVQKGGTAIATVTEAQPKRRMARGGKLNMNIDYVRLIDGEKAALRAVKEAKGGGHTGAMTGAIVATSIVFFPAAPLFLFMHGKDITIPKGTEITAYVNGNMPLDAIKFRPTSSQPEAQIASGTPESKPAAEFEIASTPDGADIEMDGNYVGNTPSTIGVVPGDHSVIVKKKGFKEWQRKIKATTGHVRVTAELEHDTNAP